MVGGAAGIGAHKGLVGGVGRAVELPDGGARVDAVAVGGREGCIAQVGQRNACVAVQNAVHHDGGLGVTHVGIDFRHDAVLVVHLGGHLAHKGVLKQGLPVVDADKLVHIAVEAVGRGVGNQHIVVVVRAVAFALQHSVLAAIPHIAGGTLGGVDAGHLARFACGTSVGAQRHRLAVACNVGQGVVGTHTAVAGSDLDADVLVKVVEQVDHNLTPGQVEVRTIGCARRHHCSGRTHAEGRVGSGVHRCRTYVAQRVAGQGHPAGAHLLLHHDGEFGVLGCAVLAVLQRQGKPDGQQGVFGRDADVVGQLLAAVVAAIVA